MQFYCFCNQKFWNKFCKPQNRGIHIILIFLILDLLYASVAVLMSTYYDNFSAVQHFGYFTLLIGNVLFMISALLSMHFLSLKPVRIRLSYFVFLHFALITTVLLAVSSFVLMTWNPTVDEILNHVQKYVRIYHRAPYFIKNMNYEKDCCGIRHSEDIFSVFTRNVTAPKQPEPVSEGMEHIDTMKFYRVPPSCCNRVNRTKCEPWVMKLLERNEYIEHKEKMLKLNPCLGDRGTYKTIKEMNIYKTYQLTTLVPTPLLLLAVLVLTILNYYACYKFPKRSKFEQPSGFLEDLGYLLKCQCGKLRESVRMHRRAQKLVEADDAEVEKKNEKNYNDFAARHELISQSLGNMRIMHTRDDRIREMEQHGRQLDGALSSHVVVSGFSSSKNLYKDERGQWHH